MLCAMRVVFFLCSCIKARISTSFCIISLYFICNTNIFFHEKNAFPEFIQLMLWILAIIKSRNIHILHSILATFTWANHTKNSLAHLVMQNHIHIHIHMHIEYAREMKKKISAKWNAFEIYLRVLMGSKTSEIVYLDTH